MTSIIKVDQIQLADGTAPTAADLGFAGGSILQVQTAVIGRLDMSTSTMTAIGNLSITPKSASSNILVTVRNHTYLATASSGSMWRVAMTKILRDTTVLLNEDTKFGAPAFHSDNATDRIMINNVIDYLDTPNTTDQITYYVQVSSKDSVNIDFNNPSYGAQGRITLMEIAG